MGFNYQSHDIFSILSTMIFLKIHTNTHTSTHNTRHAKNLRNPGRIHDPNLKQQVDVKRNLNDVRTRTLALTTASKSTLTSTTQPGFAVGGGTTQRVHVMEMLVLTPVCVASAVQGILPLPFY